MVVENENYKAIDSEKADEMQVKAMITRGDYK
jgi:hypothetical protein